MPHVTLPFGRTEQGEPAHLHLISNANGMVVGVTDVGASLVVAKVPDAHGGLVDVVLGWGGAAGYAHNDGALGATVGRVANRIAGACFTLDGTEHQLAANEGANSLHSGPDTWYERLWTLSDASDRRLTFELESPAGDQGYPGAVSAHVTYRLSEDNVLTIYQSALPEVRTPISMTNHAYWNLDGHASGDVCGHLLSVDAEHYLPVDGENIPTGVVASVAGTTFDLRKSRKIGACLEELKGGYDHNFCLGTDGRVRHAVRLASPSSGIVMDMATDAPGVQVYTGFYLDIAHAKDGASYGAFSGVALEPQGWPDAIHHEDWPSIVHSPQRPFVATTTYSFSTTGGDAA